MLYVAYLAESPYGKAYFLSGGTQTTNLASINKSQLAALPVPLPPMREQGALVERLDAVGVASEAGARQLAGLRATKSALLSALLTGRIRVTV